jgi:hypothetical protein
MTVRKIAAKFGGEMIAAVVETSATIVPIVRDDAALALAVIALLQVMGKSPAFARDHDTIQRFLVDFDVGQFSDVRVVQIGRLKE